MARASFSHLVVIGASAGGIDALRTLVGMLPAGFPAPICIVVHTAPQAPGVLHEILRRAGPLEAAQAQNGAHLEAGRIYTAPPDCHLIVEPGRIRVTKGPKENRSRPAIDPLFRSAAQVYGPGTIGVILTGNLDDGTAGLWAIKRLGGIAIVQDPAEARFPSMPDSASRHVPVDHVATLATIGPLLAQLTATPPQDRRVEAPEHLAVEVRIANEENALDAGLHRVTEPSSFACPECHGVLLQLKEEGHIRFRCHTGHAYSPSSLIAAVSEGIESSLWQAIRAIEEGAMLLRQFAEHARTHPGGDPASRDFEGRAAEAHRQAEALRELVQAREPLASRG